jgi:glycosyltransferase involved in cell wall biosynthesis
MVHSMTPKAGLLSMMAAWITRVPVRIHTFTGLVFPTSTGLKRKILMLTDRITCACATHIIPEGEGVKQDLQQHGITQKELKVLGYGNIKGIDLKHYDRTPEITEQAAAIRQKLNLKDDDFTFLFIGRLVGDKGIHELVDAFEALSSIYPQIQLILVGPEEPELDPLKEETREKIHRIPHIHPVGSQKDVRPWYAAANALVFPSYREGFPNVVIEAGAMGLPSIVTDINGSREIIMDGVNGVIVPSKDTPALQKAMEEFILQPTQTQVMGQKARPMVETRYEQSYVWNCLKEFYQNVLN